MVDPLSVFVLIVVTLIVVGVFLGYYVFEDFIGIAFGLAFATILSYIFRSWWLRIASKLVKGG